MSGNRLPPLTSPSAMYGNALPYIAEGDVRSFCLCKTYNLLFLSFAPQNLGQSIA